MSKPKKAEEILCSHDGNTMTLCPAMEKSVLSCSIGATRKPKPGLYIAGNMMNMKHFFTINRGPVIIGPNNGGGLYLEVCPWCSSDLVENWHKPVQAWAKERIAKVEAKAEKRSSKTKKGKAAA